MKTDHRKEYSRSHKKYDNGDQYRKSPKNGIFEKFCKNLFISFSGLVDHACSQWCLRLDDGSFPFPFKHEKLLFFVTCIFYSIRIIYVGLLFPYDEQIEGAIHRECEYQTECKYSEYSDRNIGKKFSHNSWKCHEWNKYHNGCEYS